MGIRTVRCAFLFAFLISGLRCDKPSPNPLLQTLFHLYGSPSYHERWEQRKRNDSKYFEFSANNPVKWSSIFLLLSPSFLNLIRRPKGKEILDERINFADKMSCTQNWIKRHFRLCCITLKIKYFTRCLNRVAFSNLTYLFSPNFT